MPRWFRRHEPIDLDAPLRAPLRMLPAMAWDRFLGWFYSRRLQPFLVGLPALAIALTVVATVAFQWKAPKDKLVDQYKQAAETALDDQDFATAEVCLRKLQHLAPKDDETRYGLAILAQQKGNTTLAVKLMQRIAPNDRTGFGPAHFWTVQAITHQDAPLTEERAELLAHHLNATLATDQDHVEARLMLGKLELVRGRLDDALEHFEVISDQRPDANLTIAKLYLRQDAASRAQSAAEKAAEHFREKVEADKSDVASRIGWSEAEWLQEHFKEAEAVLQAGLADCDDERLRRAMANLCIDQCRRVWDSPDVDLGSRLELLQRALHFWPHHPGALSRLASFVGKSGTEAEAARDLLKDALADGKATSTVHLILGTNLAAGDDLEQALLHLDQAHRLNPHMPVILNNLAWVLANSPEPELDRALEVANAAIELAPVHPEIRETRGQILVRLERWQDALADLELALQGLPKRSRLHDALALVYDELGDPELAEKHRQRSATLEEKN